MIIRDWTAFHDGDEEAKVVFIKFYIPESTDWQIQPVPDSDKGAFRYSFHEVKADERWRYRNMDRYRMSYVAGLDVYFIFDSKEIHPFTMLMFMPRILEDYQSAVNHTVSPFRNPFNEKLEVHPFSIN